MLGCAANSGLLNVEWRQQLAERIGGPRTLSWYVRWWLPLFACLGLSFFLSAQPNLHPPVEFSNSDKTYHLGEYTLLGLLLARALRATRPQWRALTVAIITVVLGSLWGASDEYHQSFVPGRDCSAWDWCADTMGVLWAQCLRAGFLGATED